MRYLKALSVAALALVLAAPAFAETQNVKVSGSIDAYFFYRGNFDLRDDNDAGAVPVGTAVPTGGGALLTNRSDADEYAMTITQVEIDADLTDNVSTVINLINQRDWNADQFQGNSATATSVTANEFDVLLDLAYVQMKEIFYSPLTLKVGRQDLLFGRGFIVGWNPQDPQSTIQADEFTQIQSFDAVRATLDFSPWTLDFVWSKITEGNHDPEDDRDLYIAYLTYKFAEYNAVADLYYTGEMNRNAVRATTGTKNNDTHTVGGRFQFDPISQITLGAELAYQMGSYTTSAATALRDRDAWATDIFGEYRFDNPWKPMVGMQYVHLSGESELGVTTSSYGSWNGSFRGPIYGWIRDYQEVYYATAQTTDQAAGQNQDHFSLYGSINPLEDLKLTANYWHFWNDTAVSTTGTVGGASLSKHIGDEVDLAAIYSYTEDVTFSFMLDWFIPGSHYSSPNDETASQFVTEVKVVF